MRSLEPSCSGFVLLLGVKAVIAEQRAQSIRDVLTAPAPDATVRFSSWTIWWV